MSEYPMSDRLQHALRRHAKALIEIREARKESEAADEAARLAQDRLRQARSEYDDAEAELTREVQRAGQDLLLDDQAAVINS